MLKNKLITVGLALTLCTVMLASCGGGNTTSTSETETKLPMPGNKISQRRTPVKDFANDIKNDAKQGMDNIMNGMDGMEEATHGTARRDGRDNETEHEDNGSGLHKGVKEHRPPAPKGK